MGFKIPLPLPLPSPALIWGHAGDGGGGADWGKEQFTGDSCATRPGAELPSAVSDITQSAGVALQQAGSTRLITAAQGCQ